MTGRKRPQVNLRTTLPQPTVLQNGAFGYLELSGPKIAVTPEMTSGGDAIARGGYGTVSRVQIRGIVIARKDVPIELGIGLEREEIDRTLERKLREVDVIKGCSSCPFIVHFYGFYVQRISNCVKIHIFMEELALSAQRLIETMLVKEITIPEFVIGRITCSVVNALCFLKEKLQMIHRDVKPSNILIDHDGRVKICDFGISGTLQDSVAQSYTGTQVYTAPEVNETYFGITGYTVKSDIWSLGITICHLATLTRPYAEVADGGNFLILAGAIRDLQPPRLERGRFSDNLVDFVSALLQREEDNRPNFNGVKSLPFFRMHNVPFSCIGSGMGVAIDNGSEYAIDNGLKYAIDRNSERPSVGQWLDNILFDHR